MDEGRSMLRSSALTLGVHLGELQCELLIRHLRAVLQANERLNLTAPISFEKAIIRHSVDSLAPLPLLGDETARLVDLGSGAGFPGIPLGIAGGLEVHMLESVKKKAAFLRAVVRELGPALNAQVHALRAESPGLTEAGPFDAVTARAVASLPVLVELAAPLLRRDGVLLAMKGRPTREELERGCRAAETVGMSEKQRHPYELPLSGGERVIITYEKISDPLIQLPRRTGMAQRRPLA